MIDVSKLSQAEIERLGVDALTLALGPAGMGLFMHQFEKGIGDYTLSRHEILGEPTLEDIFDRIKKRRQNPIKSLDNLPQVTSMNMVDVSQLSQVEIQQLGIEALTKALGSHGMELFMQQFDMDSEKK
jgi:hypothetical protein